MAKFNYFYRTENLVNGNFYYGVHKTSNLEDGYLGSGKRILYAIHKYGKENFKKEILLFFNTYKEALEYESQIVNENLLIDPSCYNLALGGKSDTGFLCKCPSLKDKISGEIFHPKNIIQFNEMFNTGQYEGIMKHKVIVQDEHGYKVISKEEFQTGKYNAWSKNKIVIKDKNNKIFMVENNNEKYLSGEYVSIHKNVKKTEEHKAKIGKANSIKQQGDKNSQYGTRWFWIYNDNLKINKKIKRDLINEYESQGWKKGRKY